MTEREYIERFAARLAKRYFPDRDSDKTNRFMVSTARAIFESKFCDPEGDADREFENRTDDPIGLLTRRYHEELRELLRGELREEIKNSL